MELHRAARALALRGLAIFPVQPKSKAPATAHGLHDATTSAEQIAKWWGDRPDLNIGVATGGASGAWVLDIDGPDGEASLRQLEAEYGQLPPTVEVITGSGRHLYWRWPEVEIRNSAGKVGDGLDVRGSGGYILCPPSVHPSGRRYEWSVDFAGEFADAPDWLIEAATRSARQRDPGHYLEIGQGVGEGRRNCDTASLCGHLLRQGIDVEVTLEILLAVNARHRPPLPEAEVTNIFRSICARELARAKGAA